jgi:His-Xaa-Ser system radical SAM maturase HxsC
LTVLLKLYARELHPLSEVSTTSFVGRVTTRPELAESDGGRAILLVRGRPEALPPGFRGYVVYEAPVSTDGRRDVYRLGPSLRYLGDGDIVRIDPARRSLSALYRRSSRSNALLVTERCDNYCLMCSQPPRDQDDGWLVDELLGEVIPLISPETEEIGLTGGEPALLGARLVELVESLKAHLPRTAVHVLSNGRRFSALDFARALGRVEHPDLMVGVPLYSDLPEEHDYVVQAQGAFDETVRGIINLKRVRVRVEVRVVIHRQTYERLPDLARFLTRNLLFVDHVALMGLEQVGFAKANLDQLWVDPLDYRPQLVGALRTLAHAGMAVSLYGHQLCVLPSNVHEFARRAISDWKNAYLDECKGCSLRDDCGGFFASSVERRSRGIAPVPKAELSSRSKLGIEALKRPSRRSLGEGQR